MVVLLHNLMAVVSALLRQCKRVLAAVHNMRGERPPDDFAMA